MEPLRSSFHVIYDDHAAVVPAGADWAFEWGWTDVNSIVEERVVATVVLQRLIASGALVPSASLLRYVRAHRP